MNGSKTYITGVLAIIAAALGYLNGSLELADAIQTGVTALMGMFIRHGVKTGA